MKRKNVYDKSYRINLKSEINHIERMLSKLPQKNNEDIER